MKKTHGFTLLELLMVVAVMGLLGTVATAGYYAAVSGMEVRGAKESVASVIQAAQQRAATDHTPTGVYFYNQLLREGSVSHNAVAVGVAVAVRAGGRVSCVVDRGGKYLIDEFSDINRGRKVFRRGMSSQDRSDLNNRSSSMRLYRIDVGQKTIEASDVYDYVVERIGNIDTCDETMSSMGGYTNVLSYAFQVANGTSGAADSKWRAGDLYGYEIAVIQLPHNMIFGKKLPSSLNDPIAEKPVDPIFFKTNGRPKGSTTVSMSTCRTTGANGALTVVSSFQSDKVDTNN